MSASHAAKAPIVPKTANVKSIALLYALILVLFAGTQLYGFTDFQSLVGSYWLPGGTPMAYFLSALIVVAEMFALPFLLRMKLSNAMRILSMILGWLVPVIWLSISIWLLITTNAVSNIGFLGSLVVIIPGWWTLLFSLALGVLSAWASWGMWPFAGRKK